MAQATIEILNSVYSKANSEAKKIILPDLKYQTQFYQRSPFGGGKTIVSDAYAISGRYGTDGVFYTGLIHGLKKKYGSEIDFKGRVEKIRPGILKPNILGITLRPDQVKAILKMRLKQRGLVVFPTGSGKTIIALGFVSLFADKKILFLCHTIDLLKQSAQEFGKAGYKFEMLGGGRKLSDSFFQNGSGILLSTIQSFSKINSRLWAKFFDITLIDEVHNASKNEIRYGRVMKANHSPIRIGFTATPPTNRYKALTVEGLFGPVIAELSEDEGLSSGIIAKPEVNLVPIKFDMRLINEKNYQKIYRKGIIDNDDRNKIIVQETLRSVREDQQVLIIVENIDHGYNLQKFFREKEIVCPFVQGSEKSDFRDDVKSRLLSKKLMVAVATKVWKEGINIPTLNHIIYASGGKDEKSLRQAMGRGLRISKGKTLIKLTDFMDPYKYLAEHSVFRYSVYKKLKWI